MASKELLILLILVGMSLAVPITKETELKPESDLETSEFFWPGWDSESKPWEAWKESWKDLWKDKWEDSWKEAWKPYLTNPWENYKPWAHLPPPWWHPSPPWNSYPPLPYWTVG